MSLTPSAGPDPIAPLWTSDALVDLSDLDSRPAPPSDLDQLAAAIDGKDSWRLDRGRRRARYRERSPVTGRWLLRGEVRPVRSVSGEFGFVMETLDLRGLRQQDGLCWWFETAIEAVEELQRAVWRRAYRRAQQAERRRQEALEAGRRWLGEHL
jgi:hypothetical protein